jgi:hypothetical protein
MLYKILNKLFGWDYILWSNTADSGIARILVDGYGRLFYWRYKSIKAADLVDTNNPKRYVWLTCHPSKYIKGT